MKLFVLCIIASALSLSSAMLTTGKLFAYLVCLAFALLAAAVVCAAYVK